MNTYIIFINCSWPPIIRNNLYCQQNWTLSKNLSNQIMSLIVSDALQLREWTKGIKKKNVHQRYRYGSVYRVSYSSITTCAKFIQITWITFIIFWWFMCVEGRETTVSHRPLRGMNIYSKTVVISDEPRNINIYFHAILGQKK